MPFAYAHRKGNDFSTQWICEILDVNIYISNAKTSDIHLRFYSSNTSLVVLYHMHLPISTSHARFHVLLQINNVYNIRHNGISQTMLKPRSPKKHAIMCLVYLSNIFFDKESNAITTWSQVKYCSIDNKMFIKKKNC